MMSHIEKLVDGFKRFRNGYYDERIEALHTSAGA